MWPAIPITVLAGTAIEAPMRETAQPEGRRVLDAPFLLMRRANERLKHAECSSSRILLHAKPYILHKYNLHQKPEGYKMLRDASPRSDCGAGSSRILMHDASDVVKLTHRGCCDSLCEHSGALMREGIPLEPQEHPQEHRRVLPARHKRLHIKLRCVSGA